MMTGSKTLSKDIKTDTSDITSLKKAEEKLKESKIDYEIFLQITPDIMYELDPNGNFTFVNDSIKQLGYTPEELTGKHFKEIIHPADFKKVSSMKILPTYAEKVTGDKNSPKLFDERRTRKRMTKRIELRLVAKKQKDRPTDYHYGEVYSSGKWDRLATEKNKEFLGSAGVIKDITDRRNTENAHTKIAEAEKKKAEELEKIYKELQDRKEELIRSEKLAYTGRIAASVAHEVRNPLTNVSMSTQQLKRVIASKDSRAKKHIEIVERNTQRINYLITELLNCARPPKLNMHLSDIHKVLKNVLITARIKIKSQKIEIVKHFYSKPSKIMVDKEQMGRVFLNLVLNAIEAMPKGGKLTILTEIKENFFVIKFEDVGKGIPEKDIIRIFDPFFSAKNEGIGLGLTLCYGVVASHEGTIEVESEWRKGSIFTISLPIKQKSRERE